MWHHREWQPGQAWTAAAGGADRRSAKNAAAPLNQSREAHPLGAAAPLPRGGPVGRGFAADWPPEGALKLYRHPQPPKPGVRTPARRE